MKIKGKGIPLQVWSGPEGIRSLRLPDFQAVGNVVSPMDRPLLPPENIPGTHFSQRQIQAQGHGAARRIKSMKNSSDTTGDRTHDLSACIMQYLNQLHHHVPTKCKCSSNGPNTSVNTWTVLCDYCLCHYSSVLLVGVHTP